MKGKTDWAAIAAEYIESEMSMRSLARLRGVPDSTLRDHARRGGWTRLRKEYRLSAGDGDGEAIFRLTDKLVRRAEALIDSAEDINARELGELMRAVKSAKEIKMLRSALDEREQAARVRALEEKSEAADGRLEIAFSAEAEEAAR